MLRHIAHTVASTAFLATSSALACSTPDDAPPSEAELFAKASSVFVAHVLRTEEKPPRSDLVGRQLPYVEGTFEVIEVIKGTPPADSKVNDLVFGPGNCSLGLFAGLDYLFFIQDQNTKLVLWPTGSRGLINRDGTEARKLLSELRSLQK